MTDKLIKFRDHWFDLFEQLHKIPEVYSGVNCLSMCQALCCPRVKMPEPRIGTFVIYLPFEIEFIQLTLGIQPNRRDFTWQSIQLTADESVEVPWTRKCPFIQGITCGIYSNRPLDCKSFPLIANHKDGRLVFNINNSCPGSNSVNDEFRRYLSSLWKKIFRYIPGDWWKLIYSIENNIV